MNSTDMMELMMMDSIATFDSEPEEEDDNCNNPDDPLPIFYCGYCNKKQIWNDLLDRHDLRRTKSTKEKLSIMVALDKEKTKGKLTSGAKSFMTKHLNPTIRCLNKHFGGDVGAFARKYPNYHHTTFPNQCCDGRGHHCNA